MCSYCQRNIYKWNKDRQYISTKRSLVVNKSHQHKIKKPPSSIFEKGEDDNFNGLKLLYAT